MTFHHFHLMQSYFFLPHESIVMYYISMPCYGDIQQRQKKFSRHVEWNFFSLFYFWMKGRRKHPQSIKASMKNRKAVVFLPLLIFAWAPFSLSRKLFFLIFQFLFFVRQRPNLKSSWWKNNESQHVYNMRFFLLILGTCAEEILLIRFLSLLPIIFFLFCLFSHKNYIFYPEEFFCSSFKIFYFFFIIFHVWKNVWWLKQGAKSLFFSSVQTKFLRLSKKLLKNYNFKIKI